MPDPTKSPPPKSLFKSKMALVAFITTGAGALAAFSPSVAKFVSDHAAAILTSLGAINVGIRMVTHGKVYLFDSDSSDGG